MSKSKANSFFLIGPAARMHSPGTRATGDKPGPLVKGAFSPDRGKQKEMEAASLSRVVEEFFWIGGSIVAFSKWRLGYMGKRSRVHFFG